MTNPEPKDIFLRMTLRRYVDLSSPMRVRQLVWMILVWWFLTWMIISDSAAPNGQNDQAPLAPPGLLLLAQTGMPVSSGEAANRYRPKTVDGIFLVVSILMLGSFIALLFSKSPKTVDFAMDIVKTGFGFLICSASKMMG